MTSQTLSNVRFNTEWNLPCLTPLDCFLNNFVCVWKCLLRVGFFLLEIFADVQGSPLVTDICKICLLSLSVRNNLLKKCKLSQLLRMWAHFWLVLSLLFQLGLTVDFLFLSLNPYIIWCYPWQVMQDFCIFLQSCFVNLNSGNKLCPAWKWLNNSFQLEIWLF